MSSSRAVRLSAAVVGALSVLILSGSAWAQPDLQLTFDPALNSGDVVYDWSTTTTVLYGGGGDVVLTAYAWDDAFDFAGGADRTATLVISLDPDAIGQFDDPNVVTVSIGGTQIAPTWYYGTPPLQDTTSTGDLPTHSIFPTWYATYDFVFDDTYMDIPDVQTGGTTTRDGFREDIEIMIASTDVGVHFDLYTLDYCKQREYDQGKCGTGVNVGDPISPYSVYSKAPFSHDAEVVPVPEPGSLALFAVGSLVAFGAKRRRRE